MSDAGGDSRIRDLFAAVTLGNVVGAALFVAALYWYVYLRGPLCVKK